MKIGFLVEDEILIQRFKVNKPQKECEITWFEHPKALLSCLDDGGYEAIILSNHFFDFISYCDFVEEVRETKRLKIILLLSDQHNGMNDGNWMKYCLSNDIHCVHINPTAPLIVEDVYNKIFDEGGRENGLNKNIILFMGSTPNVGTTVVSYTTALQLAKQTEQQIAYICLNLKSSKIHRYMGIHEPISTLDGIRAEIKSQGLTEERVKRYCVHHKQIPNFHVLIGNMVREQAEFYSVDDIHHLLEIVSSAFDLCVVEVNSYWDNAATICGLLRADTKVIVSTNQISHFQEDMNRWLMNGPSLFGLDLSTFDLFITQISNSPSTHSYRIHDVRKETGMNVIGKLNKLEQVEEMLNQGRIDDLAENNTRLIEGLTGMINMLIHLYRMTKVKPAVKKTWLNRLVRA